MMEAAVDDYQAVIDECNQVIEESKKYQDYQEAALNRVNEISSLPLNLVSQTWDMPLGDTQTQESPYYRAYNNNASPYPPESHDFGIRVRYGNASSSRGLQCPLVEPQSFQAGEALTLQFKYRGNRRPFQYFYLLMIDNNLLFNNMPNLIDDKQWHTYTYSFIVPNDTMTDVTSIQIVYGRDESVDSYVGIARGSLVLYRSAEATHWAPAPQDYNGSTSLGRLDILEDKTESSDSSGDLSVVWEAFDTSQYVTLPENVTRPEWYTPELNATIVNGIAVLKCTGICYADGQYLIYPLPKKYWPISSFVRLETPICENPGDVPEISKSSTLTIPEPRDIYQSVAVTCPLCDEFEDESGSAYVCSNGRIYVNVESGMGFGLNQKFNVAYPCRALVIND